MQISINTTQMSMTKKAIEEKKEYARMLYMGGENQISIAEKTGISRQTISKWIQAEGWDIKRAAASITRPELVNNILTAIAKELEALNSEKDPLKVASAGDRLSKLAATLEKLDKKANVVDCVEVFMAFSKYLQGKAETVYEITPDFMKLVNRLQDSYVNYLLSIK